MFSIPVRYLGTGRQRKWNSLWRSIIDARSKSVEGLKLIGQTHFLTSMSCWPASLQARHPVRDPQYTAFSTEHPLPCTRESQEDYVLATPDGDNASGSGWP